MFVFPFIEQETAWLGWSHHAGWHVTVKKCLCALMSQNGSCFDALCQIRSQKTTQKGLNLYETAGTRSGMTGENIKKNRGFYGEGIHTIRDMHQSKKNATRATQNRQFRKRRDGVKSCSFSENILAVIMD